MFGLGFGEVVLVLIIALVFIGPKKLPELAKGLGKGLREFQNAAKSIQEHVTKEVEDIKPKMDTETEEVAKLETKTPELPKVEGSVSRGSVVIPKNDDDKA